MAGILDRSSGLRYLLPLQESHGIDVTYLVGEMEAYQCNNCRAYFLNPWLSLEARSRVFVSGHPIHNMGWSNLIERKTNRSAPRLPISLPELQQRVLDVLGNVTRYAELGCPFMGLLLHMAPDYGITQYLNPRTTHSSMNRSAYSLLPQWIAKDMLLANRTSNFVKRLRGVREKLRRENSRSADTLAERWQVPERFFVPIQSSASWGLNCSAFGDTCVAASQYVNQAVTTTFETLRKGELKLDLIGLFQTLDHQDSPLDLLRDCLVNSRAVLCLTHGQPISPQHRLGLGSEFFSQLKILIPGCNVTLLAKKKSDLLYLIESPTIAVCI